MLFYIFVRYETNNLDMRGGDVLLRERGGAVVPPADAE